ncbi:hypothetical protein [Fuchsiella alkaliacetigena]|uniref:hypothetical protein n=1 Tax=Fuchsiella alkaliacetigena TaxID=957042 RepID=UPI00200B5FCF|nr:hypothetical protein [Fuchsiella alkaliacetigena]MCK8823731.1 hypothetical protein [Fuchsiella alkaliacetigena]
MLSIFTGLLKKINFKHEFINLLSFFIGIFSTSIMITYIISNKYQLAILTGIIAWLAFSLLFKRYERMVYRNITLKLLTDYDQEKVESLLKTIHKQKQ